MSETKKKYPVGLKSLLDGFLVNMYLQSSLVEKRDYVMNLLNTLNFNYFFKKSNLGIEIICESIDRVREYFRFGNERFRFEIFTGKKVFKVENVLNLIDSTYHKLLNSDDPIPINLFPTYNWLVLV
jgi:hypothetical protein